MNINVQHVKPSSQWVAETERTQPSAEPVKRAAMEHFCYSSVL